MADDIMAVDERVTKLEVTVAKGFQELGGRMDRLENRMDAFNEKLDVAVETLDGKMNLVLERMDLQIAEMRAWTTAVTREARADRRLLFAMLKDHRVRIEALEASARGSA